ncbi:MAG: hypothetical protein K0U74_01400 [Alphaproteobacteria bacterium]|nr:hypothetical protein [Alphaproteobacteria bacterium]
MKKAAQWVAFFVGSTLRKRMLLYFGSTFGKPMLKLADKIRRGSTGLAKSAPRPTFAKAMLLYFGSTLRKRMLLFIAQHCASAC